MDGRRVYSNRIGYVLLLLMLAVFCISCVPREREGLAPGNYAPSFSLPDLKGNLVSLRQFRGKVVLLNFWASWCGPCVEEMPSLERLYQSLKDEGFVVLAVGVNDTKANIVEFVDKYKFHFPVLIDEDGKTSYKYKLGGVPESFVIGKDGKLVAFRDIEDDSLTVKIIGPRRWDSKDAIRRLLAIIERSDNK